MVRILVTIDITMPHMTGIEAVKEIIKKSYKVEFQLKRK